MEEEHGYLFGISSRSEGNQGKPFGGLRVLADVACFVGTDSPTLNSADVNPYPTAFPYGNGMVLHFYQQQESSTTKTVHKVINKGLKAYV